MKHNFEEQIEEDIVNFWVEDMNLKDAPFLLQNEQYREELVDGYWALRHNISVDKGPNNV